MAQPATLSVFVIAEAGVNHNGELALALARELLGLTRSKIKTIPIPNADLQLNGDELVSQGREDKEKLVTNLKEFLNRLTNEELLKSQAAIAEYMQKMLKLTPMPLGKSIVLG